MVSNRRLPLAAMVVTSVAFAGSASAQVAGSSGVDESRLEEVIVTAERREANVQDVPIAVSAFSPEEMERRQAFNVVDVVSNVPNLVGNNNIGQGTATTVFLRGIGSTESIVTLETALGFYIDDVYISRQGVNNLSLFDVERVEVLRGPQGTLYGRNTTGGAIRVITTQPQDSNSLDLQLGVGQYDRWNVKATGNLAATDSFYLRGSAYVERGDGDTSNVFTGRKVNDVDGYGARVAGRWVGSDRFEANLSLDYYKSDQNGLYAVDILGAVRPSTGSLFKASSGTDTSNIGRTYGASLTLDWDLSDSLQLQSITGFRNVYQKWNLDLTDQPVSIFLLYTINDTDSYSQEFKLNGELADGRLKFTTGAFFYKENNFSFIGDAINLNLGMGVRVPLPFFSRNYDVDVTSYAAFAEATYSITPQFDVIVGGRFTKDDKDLGIDAFIGGTPGFVVPPGAGLNYNSASLNRTGGPTGRGVPTSLDYSRFTPKFGLQYRFSDDVNAYFTWANGWKSGGWSARTNAANEFVVFEPEKVKSYELGLKTTVADGRARLNYTAFYYDYEDFFVSATGQAGNFIVFTGDPEFYGVEFEGVGRVSERLDLFAAAGWQDGKYRDIDFSRPDPNRVVGEKPQRIPEWSLKAGGTYRVPLPNGGLNFTLDYQFLDDHFTNLQNSPLARSGNVEVWNAAVVYEWGDGQYSVTAACKNCFDNDYISQSLDFAGLGFVTVYPGPRQYASLTFRARFD